MMFTLRGFCPNILTYFVGKPNQHWIELFLMLFSTLFFPGSDGQKLEAPLRPYPPCGDHGRRHDLRWRFLRQASRLLAGDQLVEEGRGRDCQLLHDQAPHLLWPNEQGLRGARQDEARLHQIDNFTRHSFRPGSGGSTHRKEMIHSLSLDILWPVKCKESPL